MFHQSPMQHPPGILGRGGKNRKEGHQKPEDHCSEVIHLSAAGLVAAACCIWLFIVFSLRL